MGRFNEELAQAAKMIEIDGLEADRQSARVMALGLLGAIPLLRRRR